MSNSKSIPIIIRFLLLYLTLAYLLLLKTFWRPQNDDGQLEAVQGELFGELTKQ